MKVMELRIKELCEKNDITLSELAKRAGIARETLSRVNWNPSLSTLEDISKVLNCTVSDLFQESVKSIASDKITGAVRVGDNVHLINSIQHLEKLLEELKGGQ